MLPFGCHRPIADLALPGSAPPACGDEVGLSSPVSPKKRRRVRFQAGGDTASTWRQSAASKNRLMKKACETMMLDCGICQSLSVA